MIWHTNVFVMFSDFLLMGKIEKVEYNFGE